MFYYLLYNSSFDFITNNRMFSTILYGSILYIITHAIINYCNLDILSITRNYFWIIFALDIFTFIWELYQLLTYNSNQNINNNNLEVSFNLLKNKINTLLDRNKNELTITESNLTNSNTLPKHSTIRITPQIKSTSNTPINSNTSLNTNTSLNSNTQFNGNITGNMSTPISHLLKQQNKSIDQSINNGNSSTPITLLRDKINIPELKINEDTNESIAGSDIGNIMDLDDFEKSL